MSEQILNHSEEEKKDEKKKKKSRTRLYLVGGLVVVALVVLGVIGFRELRASSPFECTDAIGCVTIAPGDPIKIGSLQVLNVNITKAGHEQIRAIELTIKRRGSQVLDHPVEIQSEDTACKPESGANAALKVVADPQVVAIVGTICSGAATLASEVMSEAGLIMVSGVNVAPALTSVGGQPGPNWHPGYFRTIANSAQQGRAVATFAFQELGVTQVATVNDGDLYTQGYTDAFKQRFTELGGENVLDLTINKGDTDMHPVLTAAADYGAELIFLPLFKPEGAPLVQQVGKVAGLEEVILIGADALVYQEFIETVGADGVGLYFAAPAPVESAVYDELAAEYEAAHGEPPSLFYSFISDAVNLLLDNLEAVAVQEKDGTLHIGRQALRDAMYATTDYEGVTGRLSCGEFGDCGANKFNIIRLDDPAAGIDGLKSNVIYTYAPEQ